MQHKYVNMYRSTRSRADQKRCRYVCSVCATPWSAKGHEMVNGGRRLLCVGTGTRAHTGVKTEQKE